LGDPPGGGAKCDCHPVSWRDTGRLSAGCYRSSARDWRPPPRRVHCMEGHQGEFSMQVLSRQRGVSLIEVLVAMLIFSIGVLGIALMQIKGAQYTKQAGARTVAVLQARSLADAMRANPAGVYGVDNKDLIPSKNGDLSDSYYVYSGPAIP